MTSFIPVRGDSRVISGWPYFDREYDWLVARDGVVGQAKFRDQESALTFIEILDSGLPSREIRFIGELCRTFGGGELR